MKGFFALLLALAMTAALLAGCDDAGTDSPTDPAEEITDISQTDEELFTDRDLSGSYENAQALDLSQGDVTITQPGTYVLSGSLEGMVTVNVTGKDDKVQLVLSGVSIHSDTGAGICVLDADKVFLTLAEGTENTVEVGETLGTADGYELNAAIYSRSDLTINGSGSLTVISPAGHGISSKDDLAITGGNITVTCANHGLDANDSVRICGGNISVDSGKDGIHGENNEDATLGFVYISGGTFHIEAQGDGICAGSTLQIEDAEITLLCGGGYENGSKAHSDNWGNMPGHPGGRPRTTDTTEAQSMKGLKAEGDILMVSGTFTIDSADDSIHSNSSIAIRGGSFTISSGDDAIHAESSLVITDCDMTVSESYEGLEAAYIFLRGGNICITADDDGLNAAGGVDESGSGNRDQMFGGRPGGSFGGGDYGKIEISAGILIIHAGGDGIDSNGDLLISGGHVEVYNPKSGDTSVLDSQNQPVITGGTYIGLGITTNMAEVFDSRSSTQGFIAVSCGLQAGTEVVFSDAKGNEILTVTTKYTTQLIIVSCPEMVKGEKYTITVEGSDYEFAAS